MEKKINNFSICRVVTTPEAFVHFKSLLKDLKNRGDNVTLVSSKGNYQEVLKSELDLNVNNIEIPRDISITKDIKSLFKLFLFFRKNTFNIIHSSTPKAGLVVALATIFLRNTYVIHTFTGQRWATMKGFKRELLKFIDKLIIKLNDKCYADSPSQIQFLIDEGITKENILSCINKGSFGGIDLAKFNPDKFQNSRKELLESLNINTDSKLALYVGRLNEDKGINELIEAFEIASQEESNLHLVLVGSMETQNNPLKKSVEESIKNNNKIHYLGFKSNPEYYFCAADFFCIPSYREGFGTVVIEAAACGTPSIGTDIPGLKDSIIHNGTGILVTKKNVQELADAMILLASNDELRDKLSQSAIKRAKEDFASEIINEKIINEYLKLLNKN